MARLHDYGEFLDTVAHGTRHAVQSDLGLISVNASNELTCKQNLNTIEAKAYYIGDSFYNKYASQNGLPLKKLPKI